MTLSYIINTIHNKLGAISGVIFFICLNLLLIPNALGQCYNSGGSSCGNTIDGNFKADLFNNVRNLTLNTWYDVSWTTTDRPRYDFYVDVPGTVLQFATCTGQDAELTISRYNSSTGYREIDEDSELNVGLGCSPNGNDERATYTCETSGWYSIRISRQGGCCLYQSCQTMNSGTKRLYYRVIHIPCEGVTTTYGSGQWNGYVWDGTGPNYLYGSIGTQPWDNIDVNWGNDQPIASGCGRMCDNDNYATTWYMTRTYDHGIYVFSTPNNDDGRVLSNNSGASWNLINDWGSGSGTSTTAPVEMNGPYNMVFFHRENGGGSRASLSTCQMGGGNLQGYGPSGGAWNVYVYDAGNYTFSNSSYRGTFTRGSSSSTNATLTAFSDVNARDWRTGACELSCGTNNSVRALLNNNFNSGLYAVTIGSDDNSRISFDGGSSFPISIGCCSDQTYYRILCGSANVVYQGNNTGGGGRYYANIGAPGNWATAISTASCATSGYRANWFQVSNASGYYIDVSTNNTFTNLVVNNQYIAGASNNFYNLDLPAGTTYYYRIRAYIANCGGSPFTTGNSNTITAVIPAVNNDFIANATNLGAMPENGGTLQLNSNNFGYTAESAEPNQNTSDNDWKTAWFYFTTGATAPPRITVKTEDISGSTIDSDFHLYRLNDNSYVFPRCGVNWSKLSSIGDGDGGDNFVNLASACIVAGSNDSELEANCLQPNSRYYIQVRGYENNGGWPCSDRNDNEGTFRVSATGSSTASGPDNICDATNLGAISTGYNSGNIYFNNSCLTTQGSEPRTAGTRMYNTAWWKFTTPATSVPSSVTLEIEEAGEGSNNSAIAIYESSTGACTFGTLTEKAFDWWCNSSGGTISFNCLKPSTTYYIQAGTAPNSNNSALCLLSSESTGRYRLNLTASNYVEGPDNICSAQSMGTFSNYSSGTISLSTISNHSNRCADVQSNEPSGGQKTTWYTFTTGNTVGRNLNITVNASDNLNAEVYIYEACGTVCSGSNLNSGVLNELANYWDVAGFITPACFLYSTNASGTLSGVVKPNTTYYIRVDGIAVCNVDGNYNLSLSMSGGTYNGNDDFCNAWTVGASNNPGGSGVAHTESITNNDILDLGETITVPTFNNKSASAQEQCSLNEPNNGDGDETVWFKLVTSSNPGTGIEIDVSASNGTGGVDCFLGSYAWLRVYEANGTPALPANCAGWTNTTNWFAGLSETPGTFYGVALDIGGVVIGDNSKFRIDCPKANHTYYLQIETIGIGCDMADFTMTVKDNGIPKAPNDRICNATVLSTPSLTDPQSLVGTYTPHTLVNQNNFCATKTGEPTPSCFGSLNQPVWYKLPAATAPGASDISNPGRKVAIVHARSNHAAGDEDEINLQLALYTNTNIGSCPTNPTTGFTQRACAYEGPLSLDPDQLFNLSEYLDASCLTPATDYYLMVDGHSPWYDLLGNWKEGWFEFDVYYPREIGDLPCSAVPFRKFGDPSVNKIGLKDTLLNNSNLCTTYTPGFGANQEPPTTFVSGDGNDNPGWVYFYAPPSGSVKITAVSDPQDLIKAGIIFDNLDLQLAIFQEATQGNCAVVQMPQSPVGSSISYNVLDGFGEEMYVNCLTPGRKYYIMIDAAPWGPFNSTKGIFDLYIEDWPDYAAATNDELCGAIPLDTTWFGSTYHWSQLNNKLTARVQNTNNWCADNLNEPGRPVLGGYNETGVWYTFVAPPSGKVHILAENTTYGSITKPSGDPEHIDLSLAVYKLNTGFACTQYANPAAMTLIAQDYQNPLADIGASVLGTSLSDEEMEVECLVPGETYYLLVSGKKSAGLGSDWDYGKFNLYVTSDPRNPANWNGEYVTFGGKQYLPSDYTTNDVVCNAANLGTINTNADWYQPFSSRKVPFNCSSNTVQSPPFNNFCSTSTGDPQPGYQQDLINTFGGNHKPVWFKFTTPATGAFDPAKISVEVEAISDGCNTAIFGNWYSDGCSANSEHYEDCIALGVSVWLPSDGTCTGDLYEMDSDYDPIPYDESAIVHCLLPNTTYYIMVDGGQLNREGNFNLRIRQVQPDVVAPNNFICDAKKLTSGAGTSPASFWGAGSAYKYEDEFNICADTRNNSSSGAGTEPIPSGWDVLSPPSDAADMTHTVWYYFKTPTTGGPYAVQIDVDSDLPWPFGDLVNPKIAVWESQDGTCNYTHPNGANMVEIASEYDPLAFWGETIRAYCLEANKTYYVQVGGTPLIPGHDQGYFDITINDITPIDIPANDDVCSAFNVGTTTSSGSVTISATAGNKIGNASSGANNYHNYCTDLEPGEPQPDAFTADNTVWFKFQTPSTAGKRYDITINANSDPSPAKNDNINLQLALYEATNGCNFNGFTEIASDFDPIAWGETLTATCLKPSTTYYIQVDGSKGFLELFRALGYGYFGLEVVTDRVYDAPINDNACNAIALGNVPVGGSINNGVWYYNNCATLEPNEPDPVGNIFDYDIDKTVWFTFVPGRDADFRVSAISQSLLNDPIDLQVAVYRSTATVAGCPDLAAMVQEGADYDPGFFDEDLDLSCLKQGETYYIQIDGSSLNMEGNFRLVITDRGSSTSAPANDNFCNATTMTFSGSSVTLTGQSNRCATIEVGEPNAPADVQKSVWYRFQAPASGRVRITLHDADNGLSGIDPEMYVYEMGATWDCSSFGNIAQIASAYNPIQFPFINSTLGDEVVEYECFHPGWWYLVQVDGTAVLGPQGTFDIKLEDLLYPYTVVSGNKPANDDIATAITVPVRSEQCIVNSGDDRIQGSGSWTTYNYAKPTRDLINGLGGNGCSVADLCGDTWYKFTVPAITCTPGYTPIQVQGKSLTGSNRSQLSVIAYKGTPGALTAIGCGVAENAGLLGINSQYFNFEINEPAGTVIYLQVFGEDALDWDKNFELCVSERKGFDYCAHAAESSPMQYGVEYCYNIKGATGEPINEGYPESCPLTGIPGIPSPDGNAPTENSVYFKFVTDNTCADYKMTFKYYFDSYSSLNNKGISYSIYKDDTPCDGAPIASGNLDCQSFYNSSISQNTYEITFQNNLYLTVATGIDTSAVYYIQIDGPGQTYGNLDGTIKIEQIPVCFDFEAVTQTTTSAGWTTCGDGWQHYHDGGNPKKYIFSLFTNGNQNLDGTAKIFYDHPANLWDAARQHYAAAQYVPGGEASWVMRRYWDFVISDGAVASNKPVKVRFYYVDQEKQAIINSMVNFEATYGSTQEGFEWFKQQEGWLFKPDEHINPTWVTAKYGSGSTASGITGAPYSFTALDNQISCNGVRYVELSGIVGFSGGTGATGNGPFPSPLPIELISFTGYHDAARYENILLWSTASERNNDKFVVEKSADGVNFLQIGEVRGHGTTSAVHNYIFSDKDPYNGYNYYRLRQVDFDGTFELTNIILIDVASASVITETKIDNLYPNPTDGDLNVVMSVAKPSKMKMKVYNVIGELLFTTDLNFDKGRYTYVLKTSRYAEGTYIIHVEDATSGRIYTAKFVKQ
jgi:hypothetical protein